jgi:hypothetical protein
MTSRSSKRSRSCDRVDRAFASAASTVCGRELTSRCSRLTSRSTSCPRACATLGDELSQKTLQTSSEHSTIAPCPALSPDEGSTEFPWVCWLVCGVGR